MEGKKMRAILTCDGKVYLDEVEEPQLGERTLLVRTLYSAISTGTELNLISSKTKNPFRLGYSAVGVVEEIGNGVKGFEIGDLVACYGAPYVFHGEKLSVPITLCAKVPQGVSLKEAAFVGLGAIAIHGIRKANLQFGESVVILGLGLLGQLSYQISAHANYRVIGVSYSNEHAEIAKKFNYQNGHVINLQEENEDSLLKYIDEITEGNGVDAVVITAHSPDTKLIDNALKWVRVGGKIVIVGNVKMEFDREAFFQKEAEVLISRAAGPGRYDLNYEKNAVDYPVSLVRWTEGRNMKEYIRLLKEKKIVISPFIKEYPFEKAPEVYSSLKKEPNILGTIFKYSKE